MSNGLIKYLKTYIPQEMEYTVVLNNDKDRVKFIKRCEKTIRSSMEYKDYIAYLRDYIDMDSCAFFNMISSKDNKKTKIEVHHEPFTLYDYVSVVVDRFIGEGIPLNDLVIADEVMELHYNNMVGLIPLSKTIHEAVHNSNKVFIPLSMVYGNYKAFLENEKYLPYIDELLDKLETKINQTKNLKEADFDALKQQFTYIEMEGVDAAEKQILDKDLKSNVA